MSDEWTDAPLPFDDDANDLPPPPVLGPFLYEGKAYSPEEFDRYAQTFAYGPIKPDFLVLHHTGIPWTTWAPLTYGWAWNTNEDGMTTEQRIAKRLKQLFNIRTHYEKNYGWPCGPHLFIDDLAIYTFTPMSEVGIHAAGGNSYNENGQLHYSIGIEVVGYYENVPWPEPVLANVASAVCSLKAALGTFEFVSGSRAGQIAEHRMFNKPSCPGARIRPAFYMPRFEQAWQQRTGSAPRIDINADSTVLAPPRATTAQAVAYIRRRPHGEYTDFDLEQVIIPTYWNVCTSVGVDPLLAVAQMILETDNLSSWWAARPRRNPASLGVTGQTSANAPTVGVWAQRESEWYEGLAFDTWENDAIPAHVGRLLAYALTDAEANEAQRSLITRALTVRPLPDHYRGVAPVLRGLNGRWAVPGTDYGDRIAAIARTIAAM